MTTWIALLRGINVGGNNPLPMKELVRDLESLNCKDVRTYIQSGNVVFESRRKSAITIAGDISKTIEQRHGFRPRVLVLTASEFRDAAAANPFPDGESDPKSLHLFFLDESATNPDQRSIDGALTKNEQYRLTDRVFYLHAPDGIGRSKLAANVERWLRVPVTARNWRTVQKLCELASTQ